MKYQIVFSRHYENTPIQIYRKFHLQKLKNPEGAYAVLQTYSEYEET